MILRSATRFALTCCLLLMVAAVAVPNPQEQKQYKDRAEYDLISKVYAEADPTAKLALLNEWKQKYPETDYHLERSRFYLDNYQKVGKAVETVEAAKDLLGKMPGDFAATYAVTVFSPYLGKSDDEFVAEASKAANELLGLIPKQFGTKPDTVAQDAWDTARKQAEASAHLTVGWGKMQGKDNAGAEESFRRVLEIDPSRGQVSYWLGQVVLGQNDLTKYDIAFASYARAGLYDGPNAMPPEGRQQVLEYVQNLLKKNYGEESYELYWPKFEAMAKQGALPTERIELKSTQELRFEAEQKSREENPRLWQFKDLKKALTGPNGDSTWSQLRGALTPEMSLYVVSASPHERPGTINLTSEQGGSTEVVLNLENRLRDPLRGGSLFNFEGVGASLTKEPFRLVLNDGKRVP